MALRNVALCVGLAGLSACSLDAAKVDESITRNALIEGRSLDDMAPRAYVHSVSVSSRRVSNLNLPSASLVEALKAIHGKRIRIIPVDGQVDLKKKVSLYAVDSPIEDLDRALIGQSGYDIRVEGDIIRVASVARRKWYLPALASRSSLSSTVGFPASSSSSSSGSTDTSGLTDSTLSSDSSSSSTSSTTSSTTSGGQGMEIVANTDVWDALVSDIKDILGVGEADAAAPAPESSQGGGGMPAAEPFGAGSGAPVMDATSIFGEKGGPTTSAVQPAVVALKTTGVIYAIGDPSRMALVDKMIRDMEVDTLRKVHLSVRMYEVRLSDERGRGIDWSLMSRALGRVAESALDVTFSARSLPSIQGAGVFSTVVSGASTRDGAQTVDATLNFLSLFGHTELVSQPDLTTTNGHPAYISDASQISYVATVTQSTDSQGRITVVPELTRVNIGITMTIVPRVTRDDRIAMDVIPVISSLSGFQDLTVGTQSFSTPNIPIKELATHVVAEPGETVHLGGIITSRLQESLSRLPIFKSANITDLLLSSENNAAERREFVMTITPDIVGS